MHTYTFKAHTAMYNYVSVRKNKYIYICACIVYTHVCTYIYKFIRFCRYFAESFGFTSLDGPTHTQTFTNTHTHTHIM